MDAQKAIQQATRRAGPDYTPKRRSEELKRDIRHWRESEKPERVLNRLNGLGLHEEVAHMAAAVIAGTPADALNPIERIIGASQLISSIFLPLGAQRARAVGRIITDGGQGFGTGFLISPRLLMTNNHVLEDDAMAARCRVQFDFVKSVEGIIGSTEIYRLTPEQFFLTSEVHDGVNLDYTIVAVEATNGDGKRLAQRGFIPLIAASGKLTLGDLANIIQHPGGEPQQVALRDSQVVTPLDDFIQYEADTQPGSSGSPVFNDLWQLAALHHSGVPEEVRPGVYQLVDGGEWDTRQPLSHEDQLRMAARVKWIANEGVRISSIVRDVEQRLKNTPDKLAIFEEAVRPATTPPTPEATADTLTSTHPTGTVLASGNSVTWTLPLRVTVQLGPDMPVSIGAGASSTSGISTGSPAAPSPGTPAKPTATSTDEAAARARELLAGRTEILEIRSGYVWKGSTQTDAESVVVVLDPKTTVAGDVHEALNIPREIGDVPVDVTVGGATAVFRAMDRQGDLLSEGLPLSDLLQERVPVIGYQPPANVALDEVVLPMDVIAHVSPDDGWPVLKEFLDRTKNTITLGMFDLTAPQVVHAFTDLAGQATFKMNLAIQRGMVGGLRGEKKNDIPEDDFIKQMRDAMSSRFRQAFVDVSGDDRTFGGAYHIKVAVRDHEEFWLSSGNMQTSNQPDISPAADGDQTFSPLKRFNREWHVVIKNEKLAKVFEKFLLHDLKNAELNPAEAPVPSDEVLVPLTPPGPDFSEAGKKPKYVRRMTFPHQATKPVRIQPLLTPDNFLKHVIPVVKSATQKLFIQNQSLSLLQPLDKNEADFLALFEAIRARQQAGVDVRMIFRVMPQDEDGARATKDALVKFGFKKGRVKVQENCHTKGVIVDSKIVIVGSHNWTNAGTLVNRDASLIIHNEGIAKYFEDVFLFDWDTMTRQPKPPKPGPPAPAGSHEGLGGGGAPQVRVLAEELVLGD